MNEYILNEIMSLKPDYSTSLINSYLTLSKYVNISLINDENNKLFYSCPIEELLNSNIEIEELIYVRNGNWELDSQKKCLIKKI